MRAGALYACSHLRLLAGGVYACAVTRELTVEAPSCTHQAAFPLLRESGCGAVLRQRVASQSTLGRVRPHTQLGRGSCE